MELNKSSIKYYRWLRGNDYVLILFKLRDGEISGMDFEKQMKTMEEIKVMMTINGD